ncbi:MAG: hypothetical protein RI556_12985, partial [Hydrogenovibrio sp.]|uniref:hypothetical protein n=1 Tax=Hydrogenovibrio sp. TaxID=2065821 RepID=UPI0028703CA5
KRRDEISPEIADFLYFYPLEWWYQLYNEIGAFPSTGCMTFDMIRRLIGNEGHVSMYGFDFFKSPNWYEKKKFKKFIAKALGRERKKPHPHDGQKEEQFILNALPSHQIQIIRPD